MQIIVTKLHRGEHGELDARVTVPGGETVPVTRRFGAWSTVPDRDGRYRHVLPVYAQALQERARVFERQEHDDA